MTQYVLDMGFDLGESREYEGRHYPMQGGLVEVTEGTGKGTAQWLTKLMHGDTLYFRVWDISEVGGSELLNLVVAFFEMSSPTLLANEVSEVNPLVGSGSTELSLTTGQTSVHGQVQQGWVLGGAPSALGHGVTLAYMGEAKRFVLQVRADVKTREDAQGRRSLRTYVYDPEMVVSPHEGESP